MGSNNEDNSNKENNSKNDNDNSKKDKDNNKKDNDNNNSNNNNHKPGNKPFQTIVMVMAIIVTGINAMVYNKEENGVIKIEINAKVVVEHFVQLMIITINQIQMHGIVIGLVVMDKNKVVNIVIEINNHVNIVEEQYAIDDVLKLLLIQ